MSDFYWLSTTSCDTVMAVFCQRDFSAPPLSTTTVQPINCLNGWYGFPTLHWCIKLFDSPLSWAASRGQCQAAGADLVRINNTNMYTFISLLINENRGVYWIGLNDQKTEGTFSWLDDTAKANYTEWAPGMPNNAGGNENCVVADGNNNDKWDDLDCSTPNRFICQRVPFPGTPSPAPVVTASHTNCGSGWEDVLGTDSCIAFYINVLTWMDAQADCKSRGGSLASVASLAEQNYISARSVSFASYMFWIGANDRATESGWLWSDGTPFAFLNWDDKQPDNSHNSDCAVLIRNTGKWDDVPCQSRNGYICKKRGQVTKPSLITTTTPPPHVPAGQMWGCTAGWYSYRGSCYKAINSATGVDQKTASSICASSSVQGALVSIINADENQFVFSLIPKGYNSYTWIGLQDPVENSFTWVDGTPVQYTNWEPGEPNNNNNEDCVAMDTVNGKWNDIQCANAYSLFVCKKSKSIVPRAESDVEQGCTNGSLGYGAKCYTFVIPLKNYRDAQADCRARSNNQGNLATVDSGHLQAFLAAELFTSPGNTYWIGLQQNNTVYKWQSNWPVSFTYWNSNHTGNERDTCVGMQHTGLWANYPCSPTSMSYICESPRTGFTTASTMTPSTNQNLASCPAGWTANGNLCYHIFTGNMSNQLSWLEARAFCRNEATGGALVTVNSNTTQAWLIKLAAKSAQASGSFWIGLNDRDTEEAYIWDDNSPYLFTNWNYGEPNDAQNREDCVEWVLPNNYWSDAYCYLSKNWICQVPRGSVITTPVTPPTPVSSSNCTNSTWVSFNNHCYFISPGTGPTSSATWFDARRTCISIKADLASIIEGDENGFLTSLISRNPTQSFWIGLNDLDMDTFQWTDQSPVSYVSWAINEPNNNYGAESCVQMDSAGTWSDNQCQRSLGYICKQVAGNYQPIPYIPPPPSGGCPPNFVSLPALSYCYYVGGTTNTTTINYSDAMAACEKMVHTSELASIHSTLEQKYILTLISDLSTPAWIGFNDRLYPHQFFWVDNLPVTYTNWGPGQPDVSVVRFPINFFPRPRRDCVDVEIRVNPGTWHDRTCNTPLAYICEARKDPTTPTVGPNSTGCHQGYQRFRSSCYKFFPDLYSWSDAQGICKVDGGNLVTISNGIDQAFVEIVTGHVNDSLQFWLGLRYDEYSDAFSWQDGWPVVYTNWGHGEPNTKGDQNCVTHTLDEQWDVVNCSSKNPFVCEINFVSPPPTRIFTAGTCPPGMQWFLYNGNCYHVETASPKSWAAANAACTLMGAGLASIHSDPEARTLTNYLQNVDMDVWIGLFKGQGDGFSWYDGTAVGYLNWAAGEPNDPESYLHQDCVKIRNQDGEWADTDCSDQNAYLCKVQQGVNPSSYSPSLPTGQTQRSGQTVSFGAHTRSYRTHTGSYRTHTGSYRTHTGSYRTHTGSYRTHTGSNGAHTRSNGAHTRSNGAHTRSSMPQVAYEFDISKSSGLSGGGVAGVVVGVLLLATLGVIFGVLVYRRMHGLNFPSFNRFRSRQETLPKAGIDNVIYKTNDGVKLSVSDA
ncbi:hypothetical protein BsWGS_25410 [Bradybaena similaris]